MGNTATTAIDDVLKDQKFIHESRTTVEVNDHLDLTDDQLHKLWNTYDTDHSGSLEKKEVLKFVSEFLDALQKKELEAWDILQKSVTVEPQRSKMAKMAAEEKKQTVGKYSVLKKVIPEIFDDFDTNKDGVVTLKEFKSAIRDFDPGKYLTRHPDLCEGVVDITRF